MLHEVPQPQLICSILNDIVFTIGGLYSGAGVESGIAVRCIEDQQVVVMNVVLVG
ncbi:uncharacterized, partial [Tachysurus ichikawai]